MIQRIYQVLLYPFALFSFFFVPETKEEFESLEDMREFHFQYQYSLDTVLFCYTWLPAIMLIMPVILFGRIIDTKVQDKLRGESLE